MPPHRNLKDFLFYNIMNELKKRIEELEKKVAFLELNKIQFEVVKKQKDNVLHLYKINPDMSQKKIADILKVSKQYVNGIIKKYDTR